ncbi:hypothetical protein [Pandoravirus japonicus]|uniref:Uncharacterized protein n=1 Tax=Pandoravirus japonicus TaxID=2823154 RepID=A0A811BT31_9VIRU|nr:hypothetical protein [Pandoravirus japonicus]
MGQGASKSEGGRVGLLLIEDAQRREPAAQGLPLLREGVAREAEKGARVGVRVGGARASRASPRRGLRDALELAGGGCARIGRGERVGFHAKGRAVVETVGIVVGHRVG